MGITHIEATICNPQNPKKKETVTFLVDSGAAYSVVPQNYLKKIGIKPYRSQTFILTDGSKVTRKIADATFEYEGIKGTIPVVFGKETDASLFGALTLEALGLILDPFARTLSPRAMTF